MVENISVVVNTVVPYLVRASSESLSQNRLLHSQDFRSFIQSFQAHAGTEPIKQVRTTCITWVITLEVKNHPWLLGVMSMSQFRLGEDWFDPVFNIYTSLSPTLTPISFICSSSTQQPKKKS